MSLVRAANAAHIALMPTAFLSPRNVPPANLYREEDLALQRAFFAARPQLGPTALRPCVSLARHLGIGELLVKDETARFGLNAFKAAGALFAVTTLVERGDIARGDMIVCASEGNHGRAVARAAREADCRARVYMSRYVAPARVEAIESEGAEVVLVDGTYDEAVRVMARDAETAGWMIVSDTSWPGYTEIPWLIMLGYTRIMDEIDAETRLKPGPAYTSGWDTSPRGTRLQPGSETSPRGAGLQPGSETSRRGAGLQPGSETSPRGAGLQPGLDAVFVPAGVGGLLAAVACWCDLQYGDARPKVIAVEPASAACVQASARAGEPASVPGPFTTTMGGLRCGEMSPAVFPAVRSLVDAYVGIEDEFAFEAMRLLARPVPPDAVVECGPSGAAALGGLLALLVDPTLKSVATQLGLDAESRVAVLATEGVTDPVVFREVLARP